MKFLNCIFKSYTFASLSLLASTSQAKAIPQAVDVVVVTSIHTLLQPRVDITIPPVVLPTITIPEFHFTQPKFSLSLNLPTPTCTQTITPDKNGWVPPGTCNSFWNYYPSFNAAVATAALFFLITAVHIGQAIYFKKAYCWVICVGLFWECIGFIFRALSAKNQQSSGILTVSQLAILLAPLWMNAFSYMVLGRMVHFYIPDHRILKIKAGTFAGCFVLLDVVCFVIQLIGGGMAGIGAPPEQMKKGLDIYKAGIALQEAFVVIFLCLAVKFQLKMRALESSGAIALAEKKTWPRLLYAVYASLIFISARIIFRLVEFSNGTTMDNEILNIEWYQYVFDSVPIFLAGFVLVVSHPGMFMQGPDSVMPMAGWRRKCIGWRNRKKAGKGDGGDDGFMLIDRERENGSKERFSRPPPYS